MQEKIEKIIRETLFLWNEPDDPKEWVLDGFKGATTEITKLITAEITTLFDADKYDALQIQDATWKDSEGKLAADLAIARAQVAVMQEVFGQIQTQVEGSSFGNDVMLDMHVLQEIASLLDDAALSAAPKVVWSSVGETWFSSIGGKQVVTFVTGDFEIGNEPIEGMDGQLVNIIVLDKGEGE